MKHTNDLNAEKEMIQHQFETMTKHFENQTSELESQLRQKEIEIAELTSLQVRLFLVH